MLCVQARIAVILSVLASLGNGCGDDSTEPDELTPSRDFRQDMRAFVKSIGDTARASHPGFIVVPQNGQELVTNDGEPEGEPALDYLSAIDGLGREDLFYGYDEDDVATPESESNWMLAFLTIAEGGGVEVLVTDYCSTGAFVDDSYQQSAAREFISFAADHRELDNIPSYPADAFNTNSEEVTDLADARNFLYVLSPSAFGSKDAYVRALRMTDYDLFIIDAFYDEERLTADDVASLKTKAGGGARLVIAYMSIGEAEDYRYYWNEDWRAAPPSWLAAENPDWPGNYKVRYWDPHWQGIVCGNDDSYLRKILDSGFDGVYLDIIDAFEYFEE